LALKVVVMSFLFEERFVGPFSTVGVPLLGTS
jgi:hypothetical protein